MRLPSRQRGFLLIMAVVMIVAVGLLATVITFLTAGNVRSGAGHAGSAKALFIAESGLERAIYDYYSGTACASVSFSNVSLGDGTFTASGTLYSPASTSISNGGAGISAGTTTIPVVSTANYAPRGRIRVDNEEMDYSGVTATSFTGVRRGVAGTTAATHADGALVIQSQCTIRSVGTVAGSAQRTVEKYLSGRRSFQRGNFVKNTGTGQQDVTGVGFQPVAVIFFWTRQTATGYAVDESMGFGFASGAANQRATAQESDDDENTSNYNHTRSANNVILLLQPNNNATATLTARATFVSFLPDGFRLNWAVNDGRQDIIHYIALGGDITNAFVGTFNANTSTGNQAIAGVGFQPDLVLFLNGSVSNGDVDATVYGGKQFNLSAMNAAGQQWAVSACGRDNRGNTPHSRGQQRTDRALMMIRASCGGQEAQASFVSMNADGFTVNWSSTRGNTFPIYYLALRGGQHALGSFNQATAAGNQSVAGTGFMPGGLFLGSFNRVANTNIAADGEVSLGSATGTARGAIWSETRDLDPTDANMSTLTDRVIRLATSQTTNAEADLFSFDANGFTLNWTSADGTARQILYWAVGSANGANTLGWSEAF